MNIRLRQATLILISAVFFQTKLTLPLAGGRFMTENFHFAVHTDNELFLISGKDHRVFAAESATVQSAVLADSNYFIVANGRYQIVYGHLQKIRVKKGDMIRQGQIIGQIAAAKDSLNESYLDLRIEKDGKAVTKTNIFR